MINKEKTAEILTLLEQEYQGSTTALVYNNEFELLVAVVLSAQCTDIRVNLVTKRIFPKYSEAQKMLLLGEDKLAELIKDCGLFRTKAKNLIRVCTILQEKFQGKVPDNMEDLLRLPGVGRKTANVLLSQLFNVPAIAVDTHVFRVSQRLFLLKEKNVLLTEKKLKQIIPIEKWIKAHHWFIWHGRKICKARKPLCKECVCSQICEYYKK